MQLPAQLQEFLFERRHLDPQLARHLEQVEVVALLWRGCRCHGHKNRSVLPRALFVKPSLNKKSGWRCGCQPLVWIRLRRVWRGNRLKPVLIRREGASAAAIARGIGILENESLAHQWLFVLERRAVEI